MPDSLEVEGVKYTELADGGHYLDVAQYFERYGLSLGKL